MVNKQRWEAIAESHEHGTMVPINTGHQVGIPSHALSNMSLSLMFSAPGIPSCGLYTWCLTLQRAGCASINSFHQISQCHIFCFLYNWVYS